MLDALARPYAVTTNGTPTAFGYDPATGAFSYTWSTTRPDGRHAFWGSTAIVIPARAYPQGYAVSVTGGRVVSRPCAAVLEIRPDSRAAAVEVQLRRSRCTR